MDGVNTRHPRDLVKQYFQIEAVELDQSSPHFLTSGIVSREQTGGTTGLLLVLVRAARHATVGSLYPIDSWHREARENFSPVHHIPRHETEGPISLRLSSSSTAPSPLSAQQPSTAPSAARILHQVEDTDSKETGEHCKETESFGRPKLPRSYRYPNRATPCPPWAAHLPASLQPGVTRSAVHHFLLFLPYI